MKEVPVESKSHGYALRSRSQLDLKDHIGFQCPVCPKTFDSLRGLRIHQRKCGRNSSSASDAPAMESSLLAAHQSSDGPVQHHNAVMWGYALTHGETKRPSALNDLKLRPRLKLPNSTDKEKWKSLDEEICFASSKLLRKLQGRNSDESREMVATSVKRMHTS